MSRVDETCGEENKSGSEKRVERKMSMEGKGKGRRRVAKKEMGGLYFCH